MIHQNIKKKLENILKDDNIINLFFYGNSGSGKYTLAKYYIQKYYNTDYQFEEKIFKYENKEFTYYYSKNHYEVIFNKYNCNDVLLLKQFLDSVINKNTIIFSDKKKIFLFKNLHLLNENVLNLFRHYFEKYYLYNIYILISKKSLINKYAGYFCFIRVPQLNNEEIKKLCKSICKKKNIKIKKEQVEEITKLNNRNIRDLINIIDYSFLDDKYEKYQDPIKDKLKFLFKIMKKKNISSLIIIRDLLNELIVENVDFDDILKYLLNKYKKELMTEKITYQKFITIFNILKKCSYNISIGLRPLILLESCMIEIIDLV